MHADGDGVLWRVVKQHDDGNSEPVDVWHDIAHTYAFFQRHALWFADCDSIELAVGNTVTYGGFVTFWYIHRVCVSDVDAFRERHFIVTHGSIAERNIRFTGHDGRPGV